MDNYLAQKFVVPDVIKIKPKLAFDIHENRYTISVMLSKIPLSQYPKMPIRLVLPELLHYIRCLLL